MQSALSHGSLSLMLLEELSLVVKFHVGQLRLFPQIQNSISKLEMLGE